DTRIIFHPHCGQSTFSDFARNWSAISHNPYTSARYMEWAISSSAKVSVFPHLPALSFSPITESSSNNSIWECFAAPTFRFQVRHLEKPEGVLITGVAF